MGDHHNRLLFQSREAKVGNFYTMVFFKKETVRSQANWAAD